MICSWLFTAHAYLRLRPGVCPLAPTASQQISVYYDSCFALLADDPMSLRPSRVPSLALCLLLLLPLRFACPSIAPLGPFRLLFLPGHEGSRAGRNVFSSVPGGYVGVAWR